MSSRDCVRHGPASGIVHASLDRSGGETSRPVSSPASRTPFLGHNRARIGCNKARYCQQSRGQTGLTHCWDSPHFMPVCPPGRIQGSPGEQPSAQTEREHFPRVQQGYAESQQVYPPVPVGQTIGEPAGHPVPPVQFPSLQVPPMGQAVPQAPQLLGSVLVWAQEPLHNSPSHRHIPLTYVQPTRQGLLAPGPQRYRVHSPFAP